MAYIASIDTDKRSCLLPSDRCPRPQTPHPRGIKFKTKKEEASGEINLTHGFVGTCHVFAVDFVGEIMPGNFPHDSIESRWEICKSCFDPKSISIGISVREQKNRPTFAHVRPTTLKRRSLHKAPNILPGHGRFCGALKSTFCVNLSLTVFTLFLGRRISL